MSVPRPVGASRSETIAARKAAAASLDDRQAAGRDEILEAAAVAFTERGFLGTSIDDIADRLGATKGRVYHYYRTKGEVFLDVHRRALELMFLGVQPAAHSDAPADERLYFMAEAHARLMMTEYFFMRIAVQSAEMHLAGEGRTKTAAIDTVLKMRRDYELLFEDVIREGCDEGVFRDVDPNVAVKPVMGALNWISIWYRPGKRNKQIPALAAEFATFVVAGIRA